MNTVFLSSAHSRLSTRERTMWYKLRENEDDHQERDEKGVNDITPKNHRGPKASSDGLTCD